MSPLWLALWTFAWVLTTGGVVLLAVDYLERRTKARAEDTKDGEQS